MNQSTWQVINGHKFISILGGQCEESHNDLKNMTSLRDSKLYQAFLTKTLPEIWNACYDFCISGKNVNMQDVQTKETYMHLLAENISRFTEPDGVTVIYIMACKGIDLDIQDNNGDTFLHRVVRIPGTYRVIVAAIRYVYTYTFLHQIVIVPGSYRLMLLQ